MKTAILDLETSSFYADNGIILCGVIKEYGKKGVEIVRADSYKSWKTGKSDNKEVVKAICDILDGHGDPIEAYDIVVAHNGEFFDKAFLNAKCAQYNLPPIMRWKKSIDPCQLSRKNLRMQRNSLHSLIDFLQVKEHKTPIVFRDWMRAFLDGDKDCMNRIVKHCVHDVFSLESVYDRVRPLIDKIDKRGSAY